MSIQEETDDIIARDINRTFPDHPQFGFEQGQQALFRVLKAYSLHDLEVRVTVGLPLVSTLLVVQRRWLHKTETHLSGRGEVEVTLS